MHLGILFGFGLFSSFVSAIPLPDRNFGHPPLFPSKSELGLQAPNTHKPDPNQGSHTFHVTFTDVSGARLEGPAHASDDGVAKDGVRTMLDNGSVSMGVSSALPHNVHFVNSYPFSYRPSEGVHFDVTVQPSTTVCDPKCSGNVSGLDHPQGFRGEIKKANGHLIYQVVPPARY